MRGKVTASALLLVVCTVGHVHAQLQENDGFLVLGANYVATQTEATGDWTNGAGLGLAYESVTWDPQVALGVLLSFQRFSETGSMNTLRLELDSWIFYFYLKYFLIGNEKIQGYAAPSMGIQLSHLDLVTSGGSTSAGTSSNLALGIPIGLYWFFSDKVYLNAAYAFNWLNNDLLKNGVVHAVTLGFVFKIR